MSRISLVFGGVVAVLALGVTRPAWAQDNAFLQNPYYRPLPGSGWGPGSVLSGHAEVIRATGDFAIQMEQARLARQRYYQEQLKTRQLAFDEAKYEKDNTPSFVEEQERLWKLQLRRVISQPAAAEVVRGDTLNLLLPYLKSIADQSGTDAPVSLNPAILKGISVKIAAAGPGAGMLKDAGPLSWPLLLRGPTQKALDGLIGSARQQALAGTLQPATYNHVVATVQSMQGDLRTRLHKDQISGNSYLTAKHFLDYLATSLNVLERPDTAKYLDNTYVAHGNSVQELVENMSREGLQFAPAAPGSEAAYFALHNAFVSCAHAGESAGFSSMSAAR